MVVPSEGFEPLTVLQTIETERFTALYGVPTMFIGELESAQANAFDFSSLRTGIMAGSPCPVEVMKQVQSRLHVPEVTICYGMTETVVTTQRGVDDPLDRRVTTVGGGHPHFEIKIVDPATGAVVPRGTAGELCARGYGVLGYWNNPTATNQAIDAARWMHTGDLATLDDDGYLNIVGRIKDMIIRGGENIELLQFMGHLAERVEHLGPPVKGSDNMLKIASDARKAALDMRLVTPGAPEHPRSKLNLAADEIAAVHRDTENDRGIQLVFLDLGTPKAVDTVSTRDDEAAVIVDTETPEEIASLTDVYADLKRKLAAHGIPSHEMRFVHEAKTREAARAGRTVVVCARWSPSRNM